MNEIRGSKIQESRVGRDGCSEPMGGWSGHLETDQLHQIVSVFQSKASMGGRLLLV